MDIDLLRTFLEVDRLRHFGRAAEQLFVTQAAVSARIRNLEQSLGASLFIRQRHNIDLTPEGHRFKGYAERLIAEWHKAKHDVAQGKGGEQLSVGGTFRVWDAALQNWLHDVHRVRPELALIMESHTQDTLVRRLLDGQLDLGFILEPPQIDALNIVEVAELQLVMITNKPGVAVHDALASGFIAVDWGIGQAVAHRRLYPNAQEPKMRLAQASIALEFIREFGGSAYLSNRMVLEDVKQGQLFVVEQAKPIDQMVYAIYPVRSDRLELLASVIDLFKFRVKLPTVGAKPKRQ